MVKDHFGADCLQLQLPYFDGDSFSGIIDVLHQKVEFDCFFHYSLFSLMRMKRELFRKFLFQNQ